MYTQTNTYTNTLSQMYAQRGRAWTGEGKQGRVTGGVGRRRHVKARDAKARDGEARHVKRHVRASMLHVKRHVRRHGRASMVHVRAGMLHARQGMLHARQGMLHVRRHVRRASCYATCMLRQAIFSQVIAV